MQESQKRNKLTNSLQGDAQVERININLSWFRREWEAGECGSFVTAHSIGKNET